MPLETDGLTYVLHPGHLFECSTRTHTHIIMETQNQKAWCCSSHNENESSTVRMSIAAWWRYRWDLSVYLKNSLCGATGSASVCAVVTLQLR